MKTIAPRALHERLQRGEKGHLLDVRTPVEHAEIHVPGVYLLPLDQLQPKNFVAEKEVPVYILCRSGKRAEQAAAQLEAAGYPECTVGERGTLAWAEAGLPVNCGAIKVISLERQVCIAAGSLIVAGVLLGYFVHPWFIWLSALVGAGLIFSGVTDTCGMGLLLARLPWNRRLG